ncbi:hypothetical protein HPB52_001334 [Rhipicephalus sanguineus]|uniref:Uncharacterized protein n=1 Tax=Rhipicephalus sanguineus TaxID=34632 RepID=A0A9D4QCD2_RHISA|nr:hypothetical protein HPB52_001334 [Rhipicephalus sanguineus]
MAAMTTTGKSACGGLGYGGGKTQGCSACLLGMEAWRLPGLVREFLEGHFLFFDRVLYSGGQLGDGRRAAGRSLRQ